MAKKRMFHRDVVCSDSFLDLPHSAQCLYYQLGMHADDDGFIGSPKGIQRMAGAGVSDLEELINAGFLRRFPSGVVAIEHWRVNNQIKKDRYTPTGYIEEFQSMYAKDNEAHTEASHCADPDGAAMVPKCSPSGTSLEPECIQNGSKMDPECIQNGSKMDPQISIDKSSVVEDSLDFSVSKDTERQTKNVRRAIEAWNSVGINPVERIKSTSTRYKLLVARIREHGIDNVLSAIEKVRTSRFLQGRTDRDFVITFDWFIKPNNFVKVLSGNYDDKGAAKQGQPAQTASGNAVKEAYARLLEEENGGGAI